MGQSYWERNNKGSSVCVRGEAGGAGACGGKDSICSSVSAQDIVSMLSLEDRPEDGKMIPFADAMTLRDGQCKIIERRSKYNLA